MIIRHATLDDADAIARVHVSSWQTSYRGIMPDDKLAAIDLAARTAMRRRILSTGEGVHLVGCDGDAIVGFCDAGKHREAGEIVGEMYSIYLLERAKRSGLGRRLFTGATTWLREHAMPSMIVWVLEANAPARRFYEAMGGTFGERKDIVIDGLTYGEVAYVWPTL